MLQVLLGAGYLIFSLMALIGDPTCENLSMGFRASPGRSRHD